MADEVERAWLAEVGLRIFVARIRRRQSQEQLAELARVSRVTVGSVERSDHPAGVLTYVRLARTLGCL
jgi:transcriptional regulator with XRE-family HTH domain